MRSDTERSICRVGDQPDKRFAANEHGKHSIPELLHGEERRVYGDNMCHKKKELITKKVPHSKDFTNERWRWKGWVNEDTKRKNRTKSRVRAKVEHVFAVVMRQWGYTKVRYRRLAKNATRAFVARALANVYMTRPRCAGGSASELRGAPDFGGEEA
jgi:IS5 family transposase